MDDRLSATGNTPAAEPEGIGKTRPGEVAQTILYHHETIEMRMRFISFNNLNDIMMRYLPPSFLALLCSATLFAQTPHYQRGLVRVEDHASRIVQVDGKTTLHDFGKALFGKLAVGTATLSPGDTLIVRLGEKMLEGRIDRQPGGNIRYIADTMVLGGQFPAVLHFPMKKGVKNVTGRAILLPDSIGIILPFRSAEIISRQSIPENMVIRKGYHHRFHEGASSFRSSDSLLNAIWDLCKHTIKATTFAGLYVDGDRERIPYEADALINQLSHYAVDTVHDIARNTIDYLMASPAWPTEWQLQMHQMIWNDHMHTGNTELIRKHYALLDRKTLRSLKGKYGLISTTDVPQTSEFLASVHYTTFDNKAVFRDITDWPQSGNKIAGPEYKGEADGFVFCPYNSVVNAYHYKSVVLMAAFAATLGKKEDERMYTAMAKRIRMDFRKTFMDPVTGLVRDGDTTSHSALHSNFFALAFGLLDEGEKPAVLKHIRSRGMACSVYGVQFLLDALYDAGDAAHAFKLITDKGTRSWYRMLEAGATMTAEAWDIRFKPNLDWNHAWGTAVLNVITRKIIGIEPSTPGASSFDIHPQTTGLTEISASVPFITGSVNFSFSEKDGWIAYGFSLPAGSNATLRLDIPPGVKKVTLNGRDLTAGWKAGQRSTWKILGKSTVILEK